MVEKTTLDPRGQFFEAVRRLVQALERDHGPLYVAVVMQFKDRPHDEWTLLIGSRSLAADRSTGLESIAKGLVKELPKEYGSRIRRIAILGERDPFFLKIAQLGVPAGGTTVVDNCSFNGIEIEHAAFYVTERNVDKLYEALAKRGRGKRTPARKHKPRKVGRRKTE